MTTTNNINADLFSNIQSGNEVKSPPTEDPHIAFVQKCLHPPSAVPSFSGLPTNDARTQVLAQWRNLKLMNTPVIYDYALTETRLVLPADLSTFNYAILTLNGARVLSVPFIYNATATPVPIMTQDVGNVDIQDLYDFDNWESDANLYRPVYRSLTTYLNATAFNDTGTVAGNQFNPSILFSGSLVSLSQTNYQLFRDYVKYHVKTGRYIPYHTTHIEYEAISSKFLRFPRYVRDDIISSAGFTAIDSVDDFTAYAYNLDPDTTLQVVNMGQLSTTANLDFVPSLSQILGQSERSYGGRARDGTFTVQRLNTIAPVWLSAANTSSRPLVGLYECYYFFVADNNTHLIPLFDNVPPGTSSSDIINFVLYDTLWTKDMTWSWTRYDGLSLNTETSVNTQLLIKKYYSGYEVQPSLQSAWAGMVRLAPKPDIQSMQLVMDQFYELKDCMPAKFNFLGGFFTAIAPALFSALPAIGRTVLDFFSNMFSKKQAAPVAALTSSMQNLTVRRPSRIPVATRAPRRARSRTPRSRTPVTMQRRTPSRSRSRVRAALTPISTPAILPGRRRRRRRVRIIA
jgi:hypothetical protein